MEYFNISDDESLWKDGTHTDTGTEPQGNKRFGDARFTCLAAQQTYERTNRRKKHLPSFLIRHTKFSTPFNSSNCSRDRKKLVLCNIDFRNIQLIHHAKDSDCFFPIIPSFPKPVSVRDWSWQYEIFANFKD